MNLDDIKAKAKKGDIDALVEWTSATKEYKDAPDTFDFRFHQAREDNKIVATQACAEIARHFFKADTFELAEAWFHRSYSLGDSISGAALARIHFRQGDYRQGMEFLKQSGDRGFLNARLRYDVYLVAGVGGFRDDQGAAKNDIKVIQGNAQKYEATLAAEILSSWVVNLELVYDIIGEAKYKGYSANGGKTMPMADFITYVNYLNQLPPGQNPAQALNVTYGGSVPPAAEAAAAAAPVVPTASTAIVNDGKTGFDALAALIGLEAVKKSVRSTVNQMLFAQMRRRAGLPVTDFSLHLVFSGNPGTGKTTVARILGRILFEAGYLKKGHVVECSDKDLIGEYVGSTSPKTAAKIKEAFGGILFIDEAYSLIPDRSGGTITSRYCLEAITTLLKMMEDYRHEFVVIAAGYPHEMTEFVNCNPGLKSRFTEFIKFEDFKPDELIQIFLVNAKTGKFTLEDDAAKALGVIMVEAPKLYARDFPNARFVRNLFEDAIKNLANRVAGALKAGDADPALEQLMTITRDDLEQAYEEAKTSAVKDDEPVEEKAKIGFI